MSREKRSRVQLIGNGGAQRFVAGAKESAISDVNKTGKAELAALEINKSGSAHGDQGVTEFADSRDAAISMERGTFLDFRMPLALFVETKFVPEHVQYKTLAGRTHYQAMLKHVITPEAVSRMFNSDRRAKARLRATPGWPYLDGTRVSDLRPEHIRRIVAAAVEAGYSAQTVKHIKNVCFAIVAHAQREGCYSGPNPASLVKLPRFTRSKLPALSADQAKTIIDLLRYPHREAALFALTTGMSLPEVCDLRWKDVNLELSDKTTDGGSIPAQALLVEAWWNRGGLGDSRASSKRKIVEIREPLLSVLRELRKKMPFSEPEDLVLQSEAGNKIVPASFWVKELKRVAKVLGMPRLNWQELRRTHQVLSAGFLTQGPYFLSSSTQDPRAGWLGVQASSRPEGLSEGVFEIGSAVHRRSCFGRRLRVSSGLSAKPGCELEL